MHVESSLSPSAWNGVKCFSLCLQLCWFHLFLLDQGNLTGHQFHSESFPGFPFWLEPEIVCDDLWLTRTSQTAARKWTAVIIKWSNVCNKAWSTCTESTSVVAIGFVASPARVS